MRDGRGGVEGGGSGRGGEDKGGEGRGREEGVECEDIQVLLKPLGSPQTECIQVTQ